MKTADLDFELPGDLVAQEPSAERDDSRLLVYERHSGKLTHAHFRDLPKFLPARSLFFRNNARVFKARLAGKRAGGGEVECLLLEPSEAGTFRCLLKPGKRLAPGKSFTVADAITAQVIDKDATGVFTVSFFENNKPIDALSVASRYGTMPLPPYIQRLKNHDPRSDALDPERYQTVYADPQQTVAAAAPTAGLHFTPELCHRLEKGGAQFLDLTLHVGLGTFQPISVDSLEDHEMHEEFYTIPQKTQAALRVPEGQPRVMIGTTSVRSCEDYMCYSSNASGDLWSARSKLFILPPCDFRATDCLITNFHLPRSTLLCLVAAILDPGGHGGLSILKRLYAEAISKKYRFFSYGDAMLII